MKEDHIPNKIVLDELPDKPLIHDLQPSGRTFPKKIILTGLGIISLGILSGFILSKITSGSISGGPETSGGEVKMVVGSSDTKVFRDSAEGVLEAGGINGEGTHKLIRPGGESQTVYLTSSILDLSQFIGKQVRVWGETFAAQKAGWLMDVGKVEVL